MKAYQFTKFGSPDALKLVEVGALVPKDNQVLIRVRAASVNPVDWHSLRGPLIVRLINGELRAPKNPFLGTDVAGVVEMAGKSVTEFKPGDEVFGVTRGAFAEQALAAEHKLALKPKNVSFETAAATPVVGFTALQALRDKCKLRAGQKIAINGASGGVGTAAVQIAKAYGAEVTAICSARHVEIMRSIGADHVIDYGREDFTNSGQRYDVILAVNGYHPIMDYRRALTPEGIYVSAGGELSQVVEAMLWGRLISKLGKKKLGIMGIASTGKEDLLALRDLLEAGKLAPPIDRRYPFDQVPDAIRYLAEGHAKGKIIIEAQKP